MYGHYFSIVLADTPNLREQVYRLRYQVYCVERDFENPTRHSTGQETDDYDCQSVHAAVVHRRSGTVCGCVRLILPRGGVSLPIVRFISDPARAYMLANGTAEVSRFAALKAFRRRTGESEYRDLHCSQLGPSELRRLMPHMTLGLILAVATLCQSHGISHLAAVMAPALVRLLRNCGLEFLAIGPLVEYHGERQPCLATVADLLAGVRSKNPAYFDVIRSSLSLISTNRMHPTVQKTYTNCVPTTSGAVVVCGQGRGNS